jgi:hypothetical protein
MLRRDGFALAEERYGIVSFSPLVLSQAQTFTVEYKPTLTEIEEILAGSGLDSEEIRRQGSSGGFPGEGSRHRR